MGQMGRKGEKERQQGRGREGEGVPAGKQRGLNCLLQGEGEVGGPGQPGRERCQLSCNEGSGEGSSQKTGRDSHGDVRNRAPAF